MWPGKDRACPEASLPHAEGGPAMAVPPVMPEERKQHRLEAWVDRELRALLQTDDVAIVRAYVMGLVRGIGFVGRQVRCAPAFAAVVLQNRRRERCMGDRW